MSRVKDPKLVAQGRLQIEWAESRMPVLMKIRSEFEKSKPFKGITIGACLHVTKETAVLVRTLKSGGAKVFLCGSNPLSTQDDVAAALATEGIEVFAQRGQNNEEYYSCIQNVLDAKPNITLDDGADLVTEIHTKKQNLISNIIGGCEETTTGVIRLRAMDADKKLRYPVIAVNDAKSKNMFDNYYGTGTSALHGILDATNILIPGKNVVVVGYGHCGKGVAKMALGWGAHTIVCDVDPIAALQAHHDGHRVMSMNEAAAIGDLFITVTGCKDAIREEHFKKMKSGAILANAGHFDVEIDVKALRKMANNVREMRENVEEFTINDKKIYLLGSGRLVNLACAQGHSSEVMQMSFALQALSTEYLAKSIGKLEVKVYNVPEEIDEKVARLVLETLGINIDSLTRGQKTYLEGWGEGTS